MREEGFFGGASYTFDFGARGQLGLSLAYAHLPATLGTSFYSTTRTESVQDGTTSGLSYGLRWAGLLVPGLDYNVGYKLHSYRFKDETPDPLDPNLDSSTDQTYRIFYVGISKVF